MCDRSILTPLPPLPPNYRVPFPTNSRECDVYSPHRSHTGEIAVSKVGPGDSNSAGTISSRERGPAGDLSQDPGLPIGGRPDSALPSAVSGGNQRPPSRRSERLDPRQIPDCPPIMPRFQIYEPASRSPRDDVSALIYSYRESVVALSSTR